MRSAIDIGEMNLCCGCGNCVSVCPALALTFDRSTNAPRPVEPYRCDSCGLCLAVCPSLHELEKPAVLKCYAAYSKNRDIRYNASSGGFVTELLIGLLEEGGIDGAIVCDYRDDVFVPEATLATSKEDVIKAATSKYCPVPMNLALRYINNGKFAFVGLPCHVKGLRLRQSIDPKMRESVTLAIGLFCNHTPRLQATDYLLYNLGVNRKDVARIQYRGKGWPGTMRVTLRNGRVVQLADAWDTGFGKHFIPHACLDCEDVFSDYADISVGDPWLKEYEHDKLGTSFVIARHPSAIHLIEKCTGLSVHTISYDKVFESQRTNHDNKTKKKHIRKRKLLAQLGRFKFLWRLLFLWNTVGRGPVQSNL